MTDEGKIIKSTAIKLAAYLIPYTITASIVLAIISGISLFDAIPIIFTAFPMMFTGNILPSLIGFGAIFVYDKEIKDEPVISARSWFFTILFIIGIEVLGTIVYYNYLGEFVPASFVLIASLVFGAVKAQQKYTTLKNATDDTSDEGNFKSDNSPLDK